MRPSRPVTDTARTPAVLHAAMARLAALRRCVKPGSIMRPTARRPAARLPTLLAAGLLTAACGTSPTAPAERVPMARYVGSLPCTDCRAVRTDLLLYAAASGAADGYEMRETYVGTREGDRSLVTDGAWAVARGAAQDAEAVVVQIDPGRADRTRNFRQQGPQRLRALDSSLKDLPEALPRTLLRVPDDVPPSALVLTHADRGSRAELPAGKVLVLMLASQPSAGLGWSLVPDAAGVLAPAGEPRHVADASVPGQGVDVIRLRAARQGAQQLKLQYRAQGSAAPAVAEAVFEVVVR